MTLIELLAQHAYISQTEGMTLASGEKSLEYLNCRKAFGYPDVLHKVSGSVYCKISSNVNAIGGVATGAIPIAIAASLCTRTSFYPIRSFYIRNSRNHGTCHVIEGAVKPGDLVCIVEDVVTTGESVISAVLACQDYGLRVVQVIALVDREQNGLERIRNVTGPDVSVSALCTIGQIRECAQAKGARE